MIGLVNERARRSPTRQTVSSWTGFRGRFRRRTPGTTLTGASGGQSGSGRGPVSPVGVPMTEIVKRPPLRVSGVARRRHARRRCASASRSTGADGAAGGVLPRAGDAAGGAGTWGSGRGPPGRLLAALRRRDRGARDNMRSAEETADEIERFARGATRGDDAGRCSARQVRPGVTTAELDRTGGDVHPRSRGTPAFKGYRGFPASICPSVNERGGARDSRRAGSARRRHRRDRHRGREGRATTATRRARSRSAR